MGENKTSNPVPEHVGPDAPVRAGERSSPEKGRALLGWADEGVRPYVCCARKRADVVSALLRARRLSQ
jgi:hypothetical protein